MVLHMCEDRGGRSFGMDSRYCIDNGAMIAQCGLLHYMCGQTTRIEDSQTTQRFRTDTVPTTWREQ